MSAAATRHRSKRPSLSQGRRNSDVVSEPATRPCTASPCQEQDSAQRSQDKRQRAKDGPAHVRRRESQANEHEKNHQRFHTNPFSASRTRSVGSGLAPSFAGSAPLRRLPPDERGRQGEPSARPRRSLGRQDIVRIPAA
jgi:hypothetical protein